MLVRSAIGASTELTRWWLLATGTASPVSADSSLWSARTAMRRPSAGPPRAPPPQQAAAGGGGGAPPQALLPVPADERHRDADLAQRGENALHPGLGHVPDGGVGRYDGEDGDAVDDATGGDGGHGGAAEQQHGERADLLPYDRQG